jgi:uncharacterized membrane protein
MPLNRFFMPIQGFALAFFGLFIWAFFGGFWEPLADVVRYGQRIAGGLCVLFLVAYVFSGRLRRACAVWAEGWAGLPRREAAWRLVSAFAAAGCWLAFLSIYQHNSIQTHTFDTGIFFNVTWNAANGHGFYDPILGLDSYLGDHWQPVLWLLAPVVRLMPGGAPFLAAQAAAIALTAWGIYLLAAHLTSRRDWSLALAAAYLFHPFLHKNLIFGFHAENLVLPLIVFGIYFLAREKNALGVALLALTWFGKEDLPIVTFGIGLALMVFWPGKRRTGLLIVAGSLAAFVVIAGMLMPAFLGRVEPTHMARYESLGASPKEVLKTLILSPHVALADVLGDPKVYRTLWKLVYPFLFLPLAGGAFLSAFFVSWGPHVISSYVPQRVLAAQYSAGPLCLVAVGACFGLKRVLSAQGVPARLPRLLEAIGPFPFLLFSYVQWAFGPNYVRRVSEEKVEAVAKMKTLIPAEASVSAQSDLGPHVAFRRTLKQFPEFAGMDYVFLDPAGNTWPFPSRADYQAAVNSLIASGSYTAVAQEAGLILLRKK